ncbi:uncharacterized protein SCHCODRAFT_02604809 [Schizophyllum commune H4-8]|nr:uncharacterized protein SCHCODRAFT_02604809 [Schizophyllum commune H4-8]KAI5899318.1 hypothetical protein SCHCODRAFT_02604809 [Schizophyllum commune H4-8]
MKHDETQVGTHADRYTAKEPALEIASINAVCIGSVAQHPDSQELTPVSLMISDADAGPCTTSNAFVAGPHAPSDLDRYLVPLSCELCVRDAEGRRIIPLSISLIADVPQLSQIGGDLKGSN